MAGWKRLRVFAVGHSTRSRDELVELLQAHGVRTLVDVRTVPRSRTNPQFNRSTLTRTLPRRGLGYEHIAELGGLRKGIGAKSRNTAWRNASFRGYADYMQTDEFEAGLAKLHALAKKGPVAVMCAESLRWRCHRSLIADALVARGAQVEHIESKTRSVPHQLTGFAVVRRGRVSYPGDPATSQLRPPKPKRPAKTRGASGGTISSRRRPRR